MISAYVFLFFACLLFIVLIAAMLHDTRRSKAKISYKTYEPDDENT